MSDTRALLNRVAEFRRRLEAMPRLVPVNPPATLVPKPVPAETAGSRSQTILQESLRQLAKAPAEEPPALIDRARRLLVEAHGLVARLRSMADEPMLVGLPNREAIDPVLVHYRETASLTEAAVRYAQSLGERPEEQARLCEGLEAMLQAGLRRFAQMASILERRRREVTQVDVLARFLCALTQGNGPLDPAPLVELVNDLIANEPGRPLRFVHAEPMASLGFLGGPEYPAPARFVAAHGLNCAKVLARVGPKNGLGDLILAALLKDVGMLAVDPEVLSRAEEFGAKEREAVSGHPKQGAMILADRLPGFGKLPGLASEHQEFLDGTGYPFGLQGDQISPLGRLLTAVDVYTALASPRPHRDALDPRTALTETLLLADRGRLERGAAEMLLGLGFYPAGTVVELSDGSIGLVVAGRDPRSALPEATRPPVVLLADREGYCLPSPAPLDLATAATGPVIRALSPRERVERLSRAYPEWT